MAKKEETEEAEAPVEKKSSNMLLIIIIIVLFLIIILGGVLAFLLMGSDDTVQTSAPKQEKSAKRQKNLNHSNAQMDDAKRLSDIGTLYPIDTFTVNLKSDSARRYLKVTMSLELSGPELSAELDAKTAVIRDRIIRILTSKTLQEISSRKGKEKVSQQIMDKINSMLSDGQIKGVYFTEFVIQ